VLRLNQDYLNALSTTLEHPIEVYFKPAQFYNLKKLTKVQAIVDVELVQMGQQTYLYVLHQWDFDKAVATISKQPISKLSIFEFKSISQD